MTAAVWRKSTALSLRNLFGPSSALEISPPKGPNWPPSLLGTRAHFINCHGAPVDAFFYGQQGEHFPKAHAASYLKGRITEGTVVAAECCYGAELYDPADAAGQPGICNSYLAAKAYGFFGSSTIAYGPSEGNGSADLICQYFLDEILSGASLGRAALEARQRFIRSSTVLDPTDLKTLAQFNLMGDPSIHPVKPAQHALNRTKAFSAAFPKAGPLPLGRALRREQLVRNGLTLERTICAVKKMIAHGPPPRIKQIFERAARASSLGKGALKLASFAVDNPARSFLKMAKLPAKVSSAVHLAIGSRHPSESKVRRVVVLVATVEDGRIIRLRRLHSR
jgi:hypothetical protein